MTGRKYKGAVTDRQLALIHVAKSRVGMRDEEYRDLLSSFGVTTSKDLKRTDLDRLMKYFEKLGFITQKPEAESPPPAWTPWPGSWKRERFDVD